MPFDIEGAKKAGYSDAEIADHLGQQAKFDVQGARKAGYSDPEILSEVQKRIPKTWGQVPGEAISNTPSSAGEFAKNFYQMIRHPVDTGMGMLDIAAGSLRNVLPESLVLTIEGGKPDPAGIRASKSANAANEFLKQRYGGEEELKRTIATDPVGFMADISTIFAGGAGAARLASRVPQISGPASRVAQVAARASDITNPIMAPILATKALQKTGPAVGYALEKVADVANVASTIKPISKATDKISQTIRKVGDISSRSTDWINPSAIIPSTGNVVANLIGGLGTHTGAEGLKTMYKSGRQGGTAMESARANLRGQVPMTDVLETMKANLDKMGQAKSAEYRAGMSQISGDKTVLDFSGINKSINDTAGRVMFKGQVKNQKAADILQTMSDEINKWQGLDPVQYHTPEGLDALKQKLGGIMDSIPMEEKTAKMVAGNIYNSVKSEISKQAPTYAKVMKQYSDATEQIREIERTLMGGGKATTDTAMRKLQSLMRNNVNTAYGNRLDLARQLEQQGGREILPALAGQSLSSKTPRGLGGAVAGGLGFGGYVLGGPWGAATTLAVQSPRLMGEAALAAGRTQGALERLLSAPGVSPQQSRLAALLAAQSGRMNQEQ